MSSSEARNLDPTAGIAEEVRSATLGLVALDGVEIQTEEDLFEREPTEEELAREEELDFETDSEPGVLYTDALDQFLNAAGKHKLLTAAQEVKYAKLIEQGSAEAKEIMISSNVRLVVSIAKHYAGWGIPLNDLVQEGAIGLNRAAEKFDWRRGYKFSTYATWWVRQAVQRAVANQARTIRMPVHVVERYYKIHLEKRRVFAQTGQEATIAQLIEATKLTEKQILEVFEGQNIQPRSLNTMVGEEGDAEYGDLIDPNKTREGLQVKSTEEQAEKDLVNWHIKKALNQLDPKQKRIIELRFGLDGCEPQSLEAIGKDLRLTRERVRQIETEALRCLAKNENLEGLSE